MIFTANTWLPACAGMTKRKLAQRLSHDADSHHMVQKPKKCDRFAGYVVCGDISCEYVAKIEKMNHVRLAS